MPKTVFVAHPMSGDIEGNTLKVVAICREIHSAEVIPVFPSFTTRRYLTLATTDRELASAHIQEYFRRGFVDELWLYGDRLTEGMKLEVALARDYEIVVVPKTRETAEALGPFWLHMERLRP